MDFVDDEESSAWATSDLDKLAVYTKTQIRGPVVQWILHAQIRHRLCNDVVYVGEDFIEVKQVGNHGHQTLVARKNNFDAHIRAAAVFSNEDDAETEDFMVKLEADAKRTVDSPTYPPQSVMLTLDSNDLVFLYMHEDTHGHPIFVQQSVPMPSFDRILFQPGEYLAVDPFSRAFATAANEREVLLYSAKPKQQIQHEISTKSQSWCPISSQRPLQVDGVILQMDFLVPPADDMDHIILLLIVADQRRTKAVRIDWHFSSGLFRAHIHPGQSLDSAKRMPSLLVPLRDASFLLVTDDEIVRWKNILSGVADGADVPLTRAEPKYPGSSPQSPMWASWTKPRRSQAARRGRDSIYLAREDGLVYLMDIDSRGTAQISLAGDLKCHIGTAFASLGDEGDPDILAVAGDASSGRIVSIGHWPSPRRLEELSRDATMEPDIIEILPNWASAMDMLTVDGRKSKTTGVQGDALFVTSGRQPYGALTELRSGIDAPLSAYLDIAGSSTTDMWSFPDLASGSVILVLSAPTATRLIRISADLDQLEEIEVGTAFEVSERTLFAGITANDQMVQATTRTICVSTTLEANFEDTSLLTFEKPSSILAATLVADVSALLTAERHDDHFSICCYSLPFEDSDSGIQKQASVKLKSEALCVAAVLVGDSTIAITATNDGMVACLVFNSGLKLPLMHIKALPTSLDSSNVCDSVAILQSTDKDAEQAALLAVCGLRDGRIVTFEVDSGSQTPLGDACITPFCSSSVKLVSLSKDRDKACAMGGGSTCLLSWNKHSPDPLHIDQVWITDKLRPSLSQAPVVACAQLPIAANLATPFLADAIAMVSGDELLVAGFAAVVGSVPRQIPVSGTPTRVIYAHSTRCIVCCSVKTEVRTLPSSKPHSPPEQKRQIWPIIDFIPAKSDDPSFSYQMQPGERVSALLEWSFKQSNEKTYSFILVGGSYVRQNGARRGRITFLQPTVRNWEVVDVCESGRNLVFDDQVYAMALYDDMTCVICAGDSVYLYMFFVEEKKWNQICKPFKLASPGIKVTIEEFEAESRLIVISTLKDSIVSLLLDEEVDDSLRDLTPTMVATRADSLLGHYTIKPEYLEAYDYETFTLATTKHGQLFAISRHQEDEGLDAPPKYMFEAQLPHSLVRLAASNPSHHRGDAPKGIPRSNETGAPLPRITGCATNGAIMGILLIEDVIWKRLSWLQSLVEWCPELSPHSYASPAYSPTASRAMDTRGRAVPVGLHSVENEVVMLFSGRSRLNDMHIDGDVLERVFERGAIEALESLMKRLVREDHAVGAWLRKHINEELGALHEVIRIVRDLNRWM
ncbi:hypothetical protein CLAFUW4_03604 [Fulvia fulva]|uniref:RSE1/DDB1/CPSF1 first beta-propeller domain-containing protein n=1 Tax=Passalora fulva TaxID=5499 RepID=A0A9Q8P569_PASFU|nr:uncharacterized protein CLAFUR5_03584 [Fulvia fulva]KAK4631737.1 hypothetical protein CLAFUR4_03592 [Fulvia fulva]KAK4632753.1 hypothetical protein CLAFUR0_03595 [Fulvia fulva]UJO13693.1 hypothetical protein CLAFUR5_03584 [Fulvia fulva]WPV10787.1 hypothetical protein CLAFUW4_03604 [Fulvia fulva]WPV25655.1 hypothetical protein CLAFUW7_03596 [Fulvia fulva]